MLPTSIETGCQWSGAGSAVQRIATVETRMSRIEERNQDYVAVTGDLTVDLTNSRRQGFLIQANTNITVSVPQPVDDYDINDYHLVFCSVLPQDTNIVVQSLDPDGNPYPPSQITLLFRQKEYDPSGALISAVASPQAGVLPVMAQPGFKGDCFVNLLSCGKGIQGNYMYQGEIEIYNNP